MPQYQHIQLRLMVPHQHRRPRIPQAVPLIANFHPHPREEPHHPLETPRRGPLPQPAIAEDIEEGRGHGAVEGAQSESGEGGEGAAVVLEGRVGGEVGEAEEELDGEEVGEGEEEEG